MGKNRSTNSVDKKKKSVVEKEGENLGGDKSTRKLHIKDVLDRYTAGTLNQNDLIFSVVAVINNTLGFIWRTIEYGSCVATSLTWMLISIAFLTLLVQFYLKYENCVFLILTLLPFFVFLYYTRDVIVSHRNYWKTKEEWFGLNEVVKTANMGDVDSNGSASFRSNQVGNVNGIRLWIIFGIIISFVIRYIFPYLTEKHFDELNAVILSPIWIGTSIGFILWGIIFYGIQKYLQGLDDNSRNTHSELCWLIFTSTTMLSAGLVVIISLGVYFFQTGIPSGFPENVTCTYNGSVYTCVPHYSAVYISHLGIKNSSVGWGRITFVIITIIYDMYLLGGFIKFLLLPAYSKLKLARNVN